MTIEQRLSEALRAIPEVEPSPDLFARLERSVGEDRRFRRRRSIAILWTALFLALEILWVAVSLEPGMKIAGWKLVVAYLASAAAVVGTIAPNIRRFARSFIDDVFHLDVDAGSRFLTVMDIAYYSLFSGFALVDADLWRLTEEVALGEGLENALGSLAFLLLGMGMLHAANIALLPVLGLVFNSIVRKDLRARAGSEAPRESLRARTVDRHARSIAIGVAVLAVSLAVTAVVGPVGGLLIGGLE